MAKKDLKNKIATIIIEMERPFSLSGLFWVCKNYGISDKELILEVLEDLCDTGIVSYTEIDNDCWAYTPCA